MPSLPDLVAGRSVALVGNSAAILVERPAKLIDAAECVIRINKGLPSLIDPDAIGRKTTIWATARYWPECAIPDDCETVLWMKLTRLGDQEWREMLAAGPRKTVLRWPNHLEMPCRDYVGASPGTGIRLLWWLKTHCKPTSVAVYGMDCWQNPTHWSGESFHWDHSAELERDAMNRLLAT